MARNPLRFNQSIPNLRPNLRASDAAFAGAGAKEAALARGAQDMANAALAVDRYQTAKAERAKNVKYGLASTRLKGETVIAHEVALAEGGPGGEDYEATGAGEETVDGQPCLKLELTATRKGVSYPRVLAWIAKKGHAPVRAELYVASDKLAKVASFTLGEVDGRRQVTTMTLVDHLQKERRTEVHYLARQARTLGDEWFNPAFLVRAESPQ